MTTLKQWIDEMLEKGEKVEAIIFGECYYGADNIAPIDKVLTLKEAVEQMSVGFDSGYGSAGCPPMTVWTDKNIFIITEYDGATGLMSIPRNPTNYEPSYG